MMVQFLCVAKGGGSPLTKRISEPSLLTPGVFLVEKNRTLGTAACARRPYRVVVWRCLCNQPGLIQVKLTIDELPGGRG